MRRPAVILLSLLLLPAGPAAAGPYGERGINGYVGADWQHAGPADGDAVINPVFRGWATAVAEYLPADQVWSDDWNDPNKALGPASGDHFDIVSLGELDADEIASGRPPGSITLEFTGDARIMDVNGYDFAVFENGFISEFDTSGGSLKGQMLSELAYVEVSTNGLDFARFPSVSLTRQCPGPYGTIDVSDVFGLAGKHPNGFGFCTGTPFDLETVADHPHVTAGLVVVVGVADLGLVERPAQRVVVLDQILGEVGARGLGARRVRRGPVFPVGHGRREADDAGSRPPGHEPGAGVFAIAARLREIALEVDRLRRPGGAGQGQRGTTQQFDDRGMGGGQ
jgi:hypothetical protein